MKLFLSRGLLLMTLLCCACNSTERTQLPAAPPTSAVPTPTQPITPAASAHGTADDFTNAGFTKLVAKDYSGAAQEFSQALQLDPTAALAYYYRGLARSQKGDKPGAAQDYQAAAERFQQQGQTDQARKMLTLKQQL